jgi:peptide/nickel transport system permease protein
MGGTLPGMTAVVVGRRLAAALVTLLVASFCVFAALSIAPGDPATLLSGGRPLSSAALELIRRQYHLDDPFLARYVRWLAGAVHGDFGQSFVYRDSVNALIGARIVNTLFLMVYASVLIIVPGVLIGVASALSGRVARSTMTVATGIAQAVPVFVAAIVLITLFAVNLHWFPTFGAGSGFGDRIRHLTLPAIALALSYLAWVSQVTRATVTEELGREHVMTARARGIRERNVLRRHVLRNALPPITAVSGLTVAGLVAGAVVAEKAFAVNGLGSFLVDAVQRKDFAVVQAIALILVSVFILTNTVVDAVNAMLDPRIRQRG